MRKHAMMDKTCGYCGTVFSCRQVDHNRGKAKTCSRACLYKGMVKTADRPFAQVTPEPTGGVRVKRDGLYDTLIDADDVDWFLDYEGGWSTSSHGYVQSSHKVERLHRLLIDPPFRMEVDHKNRDRSDNRRANLRVATDGQNSQNTLRANKHGLKGVIRNKRKFFGIVTTPSGARRSIGYYPTPEDAARAWDALAKRWWGEFAYLNFPDRLMSDDEVAQNPRLTLLLAENSHRSVT